MIEPSGLYWGYYGAATGKGRQAAKAEIEKLDLKNVSMKEAVGHAAKILYVAHEESKDKEFVIEMTWVGSETDGRHKEVPRELVEEAERKAKRELEGDYDDEEEEKMEE